MKRKILSLVLSLAMLVSLMVPAMAAETSFPDTQGHWGEASVGRWADVSVLKGTDTGSFNPDANMTRAEFAQMMVNLMGYSGKSGSFTDVPSNAWYADAIYALASSGVMQGDGNGHANPLSTITRAESAVLLCRALNLEATSGSMSFADASSVPSWAKDAMVALAERGMISGVGGNQIAPVANITRASVAKLLDNMVSVYVTDATQVVTGTVKGLVIVAANGATFTDATVTENVIVAPKAGAAEIKVTGKSSIDTIYISNPNMKLSVEGGTVKNVVIEEAASGVVIDVAKGATVNLITTSADNVTIKGEGTVKEVSILAGDKVAVNTEGTVIHVAEGVTNATSNGEALEPGKSYNESTGGGGGGGVDPAPYNFIYRVENTVEAKVNNAIYFLGNQVYHIGNDVYRTYTSIYVGRETLTTNRASSANVYTFAYTRELNQNDQVGIAGKIIEAFKTVFGINNGYSVVLSRAGEQGVYVLNNTAAGTTGITNDLVDFLFADSDKNITGTVYHLNETPFVFTIEVPRA